jgi:hypothetical protein
MLLLLSLLIICYRTLSNTEYWNYGPEVEQQILGVDNLRYRLLPYIYSTAWAITNNSYTLQRHFAFDFLADSKVFPCCISCKLELTEQIVSRLSRSQINLCLDPALW